MINPIYIELIFRWQTRKTFEVIQIFNANLSAVWSFYCGIHRYWISFICKTLNFSILKPSSVECNGSNTKRSSSHSWRSSTDISKFTVGIVSVILMFKNPNLGVWAHLLIWTIYSGRVRQISLPLQLLSQLKTMLHTNKEGMIIRK